MVMLFRPFLTQPPQNEREDDDNKKRKQNRGQYPKPRPRDNMGEFQNDKNDSEQANESDASACAVIGVVHFPSPFSAGMTTGA